MDSTPFASIALVSLGMRDGITRANLLDRPALAIRTVYMPAYGEARVNKPRPVIGGTSGYQGHAKNLVAFAICGITPHDIWHLIMKDGRRYTLLVTAHSTSVVPMFGRR